MSHETFFSQHQFHWVDTCKPSELFKFWDFLQNVVSLSLWCFVYVHSTACVVHAPKCFFNFFFITSHHGVSVYIVSTSILKTQDSISQFNHLSFIYCSRQCEQNPSITANSRVGEVGDSWAVKHLTSWTSTYWTIKGVIQKDLFAHCCPSLIYMYELEGNDTVTRRSQLMTNCDKWWDYRG